MACQLTVALVYGWFIDVAAAEDSASSTSLVHVDVSAYPWSSIAKLNNSIGGSCTAVVIERDSVLTAAHCTFNRRTNRFLPSESLHVLLGYERGQYAVHALVSSYIVGPGYDPANERGTASSDWAVLKLVEALPNGVQPLRFVDRLPSPDTQLMIGGYAGRRLYVMTADINCQLIGELPSSSLLQHNCRVEQGSSGAPLLMMERGGEAVIIGIQVGFGRGTGGDIMLAVSAQSIKRNLLQRSNSAP